MEKFLITSVKEMEKRGIASLDFVIISGDAYVDHHSFGAAIIGKVLENAGFTVGIIAQPNWKRKESIMSLGKPNLGFLITSGNMDSMVNHYTVNKRKRRTDMYSPGGKTGRRPDRAVIVYSNLAKSAWKDVPVIIGGIESSLRRFGHYDYWSNSVRRSILVDSRADLLVYGMAENIILEIARDLKDGLEAKYIRHLAGTCYMAKDRDEVYDYEEVPSFEEISKDKRKYAEAFKIQYENQDPIRGKTIIQKHGDRFLVQNPPAMPLRKEELDKVYGLKFTRKPHPMYDDKGGIPAIEEVKHSIVSSRGCFGNCSFCALAFHQGRIVQSRSHDSILKEANLIVGDKSFKGYINDVGGPTANFRNPACKKQLKKGTCKDRQCLYPTPCKAMDVSHEDYTNLLRKLRKVKGVKKVFVRSGLRYDYIMAEKNDKFLKEICEHHVSGQLKVAPEHISERVLKYMGKPGRGVYEDFRKKFFQINKKIGKEQYLIPYLMSSHPGSDLKAAIELAEYLKQTGYQPEQVQDFYPTPGTLSTTMFYTGLDPMTMNKVYVPKSDEEKNMQRALLQFSRPENYDLVKKALIKAGRQDLIGYGPKCLIYPEKRNNKRPVNKKNRSDNKTEKHPKKGHKNKARGGKNGKKRTR